MFKVVYKYWNLYFKYINYFYLIAWALHNGPKYFLLLFLNEGSLQNNFSGVPQDQYWDLLYS